MTHLLSLAGLLQLTYRARFWVTVDDRAARLQDVLFNEPWFIAEGLLWAAIAWIVRPPSSGRRVWFASAAMAVAALFVIGLLRACGVIGRFVIL